LQILGLGTIEKRLFLQLVRRGYTVFDVGANIGFFTTLFSDLVGPHGSVHAFEPVPPTFATLTNAIRHNGRYRNVFANALACSDSTGAAEITVPGGDIEQASLRNHADGSWAGATDLKTYHVPTIRLDDYISERAISRLDFIKCDAEGAELLVLKGATGLLRQLEPILFLEVSESWTRDFGYCPDDIADFLEDAGYTSFYIDDEKVQTGQLRKDLGQKAKVRSVNVLCAGPRRERELSGI